jgi:predicted nucleic acid-binding protein
MPWLFDTDAISELLKRRPAPPYVEWLAGIPRTEQFTSAIVIGELFRGAYRSADAARHLENIASRVLPAVTVLPFDTAVARKYGEISAALLGKGQPLADADLAIAATAIYHGLDLATGNVRHYRRIPGLRIEPILADTRGGSARWNI